MRAALLERVRVRRDRDLRRRRHLRARLPAGDRHRQAGQGLRAAEHARARRERRGAGAGRALRAAVERRRARARRCGRSGGRGAPRGVLSDELVPRGRGDAAGRRRARCPRPRATGPPPSTCRPASTGSSARRRAAAEGARACRRRWSRSRRAPGMPVWIPDDVAGHCCGTPWNSKGYREGAAVDGAPHRRGAVALERRGRAAGRDRRQLLRARARRRGRRGRSTRNGASGTRTLELLDSVAWAHDRLLPSSSSRRASSASVAIHPTCSARHLALTAQLEALARARSPTSRRAGCRRPAAAWPATAASCTPSSPRPRPRRGRRAGRPRLRRVPLRQPHLRDRPGAGNRQDVRVDPVPARGVDPTQMKLEGIHHITAITENGQKNVDFYAGVMGLRLVKKTVNQDQPDRLPPLLRRREGQRRRRPHLLRVPRHARAAAPATGWSTGSAAGRLRGGARVLGEAARRARRRDRARRRARCASPIPRASATSCASTSRDEPLIADHPEVPTEMALQGFDGALAYSSDPDASQRAAREALGFEPDAATDGWEARGESRGGSGATTSRRPSAGSRAPERVHHIAWASKIDEHEAVARARDRGRRRPDPGDRPLLLQVDLLPRAERRPVRDRHARPRLHRRRAARAPRREARRCRPTSSTCASRSSRTCGRSSTRAPPPRLERARRRRWSTGSASPPASRRARWSCCTAAAPTRTTSSRCSTSSTPSGACSASPRAAPLTNQPPGGRHWYAVEEVG